MSSKATTEGKNSANPPKKIGLGNVVIFISLIVLIFIFHKFSTVKDSALNQDYYRVLYEASNKFNISLNQLKSSQDNNANINAIKALLPSYNITGKPCVKNGYEYSLAWDHIKVRCKVNGLKEGKSNPENTPAVNQTNPTKLVSSASIVDNTNEYASLPVKSIMPATSQGFSQFLLVHADKRVLSSVGKDNRISIVDIASIQEAIVKSKQQSQWSFTKKATENKQQNQALPNMSTDIDLTLSSGEFRVFMFPFKVKVPILDQTGKLDESQHLYLVGLIPKQKLAINGSGYWDLTLLVVTVACVLFSWVILRLFMLPKNHVVSRMHRYSIQLISYFFFIVLVALLLANMQKSILQADKDQKAIDYLTVIDNKLEQEIISAFNTLKMYRSFYQKIYVQLKAVKSSPANVCNKKGQCEADTEDGDQSYGYDLPYELIDKKLGIEKIIVNQSVALKDNNNAIKKTLEGDELNAILHKLNINLSQNSKQNAKSASFYNNNLAINLTPFQSYVKSPHIPTLSNGLLNIFTVNSDGITAMPSVSFKEINNLPTADNLSHRAYYQLVRDQQGSTIKPTNDIDPNAEDEHSNVHIQRLLNVADGTLGTTISMPLCTVEQCTSEVAKDLKSYVLGADILLTSLSVSKPSSLDFTYMIINRNDGDVLFHSNEDRSMVENLFYSSHETSNVEHWIRAGLDNSPEISLTAIKGFYHGKKGRFFINASVFDKWSIVVFYPDDSLDTLMTNEFLYIVICFALIMAFIVCYLYTVNFIIYKFNLPAGSNNRLIQRLKLLLDRINKDVDLKKIKKYKLKRWAKVFSIYIACGYMLFFILNQFYLVFNHSKPQLYHIFYVAVMSMALIFFFYTLKYKLKENKRLWQSLLMICMMHIIYFHVTALLPIKSLNAYYYNYQCSQTNLELIELNKIALMLYPNTLTQHNGSAKRLLKMEELKRCKGYSSEITPDDLPSLSSLEGSRYFWRWAKMYFLHQQIDGGIKSEITTGQVLTVKSFIILKYIFLFSLLVAAWEYFQRKVLIGRVYCQESFLKYIQSIVAAKLANHQHKQNYSRFNPKLEIDMNTPQTQGVNLDWLISSSRSNFHNNDTLKYFPKLYSLSPCLQKLRITEEQLKNLCISIAADKDSGLLKVYLSEIETCLNFGDTRLPLLSLITDIKTLVDTQLIASFTLVAGFNSLQKVEMKALLPEINSGKNQHIEYISWSDCLKDFRVKVPTELTSSVHKEFLDEELEYFPELNYLKEQVQQNTELETTDKPHWGTLHYVNLCSEALFRFKWELCSNEEKLALYHLAKGHRLNPLNSLVIEHLAINGLIKVNNDHLVIINNSFAEFVRNAESLTTLNSIVKSADQGPWRNYRLPLTLMIFLGIAGIALTSGESLFIIFGSLTAMATTLAGFANSANLIKGHMK